MYPDSLPPFRHALKIWLLTIQFFMRGFVPKDAGRCAIPQPNIMSNRIGPHVLREFGLMQHGTHTFDEAVVERFGHTIMLWCVSRGEASLRSLLAKEICKLIAHELTAAVRPKTLDMHALYPCCESLVCLERFGLGAQIFELGPAGIVISKGHVVFAASETLDWRGTPQITVYLITELNTSAKGACRSF
jgi:hypothetical protein